MKKFIIAIAASALVSCTSTPKFSEYMYSAIDDYASAEVAYYEAGICLNLIEDNGWQNKSGAYDPVIESLDKMDIHQNFIIATEKATYSVSSGRMSLRSIRPPAAVAAKLFSILGSPMKL